jgi:DNA polymerase I-like protein with 3'-5' exonuclease and polymerase domains
MTAIDVWPALRKAVREARRLGAEFRVIGRDVEIDGDLPPGMLITLPPEYLFQYFGAARADKEAVMFLRQLGVEPVLVDELNGAKAAMDELTNCDLIGLDIETGSPDMRPPPIRINSDGGVAARQEEPSRIALDPHRATIATVQLYGGGARCFIFRGLALSYLINSRWFREQHLVAHNAAFEVAFLRRHSTSAVDAKARYPVECTMQAVGLLHGPWRRSLATACQDVLGIEPPKALQVSCWAAPNLSRGQVAYAASDAVEAYRLWQTLRPALAERGRRFEAYELQRDAIPAIADMQLRGLGFDPQVHAHQAEAWARELAEARRDYLAMAGKPAPSKPDEVRAWLSSVAGERLATWPRTATGELSIERKHLKRLALSDEPTVKPVLAILAKEKLLSTFGLKLQQFINPITRRLHAHYNLAGTKSGRFSCSAPNLQQLPSAKAPEFKNAIIAAPGHVLVGGDWSQIEMRAAAWISQDPALTAVYEQERDLHIETAAVIAGVSPAEVTPAQRQGAKAVNFGSIYGIGARTLAENAFDTYGIDMTEADAGAALDRFFLAYHVLKRWRHHHANQCQLRGYVEIGCGRAVEAKWEKDGRLSFPQCCNLPVQGAAADAMLRALALVFQRLGGIDGGLVACVHDELLLEVVEADAEAARAILQETMVEAFATTFPGAPLAKVVEVKVGRTWKDVK